MVVGEVIQVAFERQIADAVGDADGRVEETERDDAFVRRASGREVAEQGRRERTRPARRLGRGCPNA